MGREKRRSSGLLRVPFVQRCEIVFDGDGPRDVFIVNINVMGAFIADDQEARLGQSGLVRFRIPGNENEVRVAGVVVWINARQQHPVHSLPVGYGVEFRQVTPDQLERLRGIVSDWVARTPSKR